MFNVCTGRCFVKSNLVWVANTVIANSRWHYIRFKMNNVTQKKTAKTSAT